MVLRRRKMVLVGGTTALAVASPLAFTLGSPGVADAVSASIITATAVAALAVPLWPSRNDSPERDGETGGSAVAEDTGRAQANDAGDANSGVRRRRGAGGPLRAEHTGPAIARGPDSHANSGVEEVD
ncbi:hypothetical protein [Streptomyces sp. NPDC001401]|uniref:hypothetical protein n=1 Tax=Streptomyces sp. NPDC001401 TaxID=3364570 RepID=UPI00367C95FA